MNKKLAVFVYGSLLEGFHNHEIYVKPYQHESLSAEIRGELFHLPEGYPGLLHGTGTVKGCVYLFSDDVYEEALRGLDELEMYYGPGDSRNEYEREEMLATLAEGERQLKVFVYRYADGNYVRTEGTRVENGDWRSFMKGRAAE